MQLAQNSTSFFKETQVETFDEKIGVQVVHFNENNQVESSETRPIEVYLGSFSDTCEDYLRSRRFVSNFKVLD